MRKVIHWAIANQGLVATSSDPRYNWPMSVDVYINDGRNRDPAAQYEWSETWVAPPSQSSIVRQSDNSTTRTDVVRAGETCGVGVRVGSCGVNVANDVAVTLYAANGAPGSATGAIFTRIAQAGPQKVVPDRTSKEGADFLLLWTPTAPGKYTLLAVAQSPDDVSDILGRLPS